MQAQAARMTCPECGVELNHHADKPVDPIDAREAASIDPELGTLLLESHCCPECGKSQCRRTH